MKSKLLSNYLYNLCYQVLIFITPIITMPYVSRVLGDENIGLYNFFNSMVSYFVLFGCMGLNLYGQREIAFCKDKPKRRTRVFLELYIIRLVTLTLSIITYYFLIVRNSTSYSLYYAIFLIELFSSLFDISWFYQGMEEFKVQALRNLIVKVLATVLIFVCVKTERDLGIYIACTAGANLIGSLSLWVHLPKYLTGTYLTFFGITKHITPVLLMFMPQIATSIYSHIDKTMIRIFSDYFQVGYYSQAEKIVKIILSVVTSLGAVMLSRIADKYAKGDFESIKFYIKKSFKFLFTIAYPVSFGLMAVATKTIPWFLGDDFEPSAYCVVLLAPIILFIGISNILGTQYLLPTRKMKEYTVSVSCGLVVNVFMNTILISKWGCFGAAVATCIGEIAVLFLQFFFVRKDFKASILLSGTKNFIAALIMAVTVYTVLKPMPAEIETSLFGVALGVVIYIVLLFILKERFMFELIKSFFGRKKNKQ